ncbi:MAG TPA: hypothetical protein VEK86_01755 [Gemmatimonadales bacterium]|nr:hypothetical protein [Gemmatimonadales bacterium]
MTPGTRRWALVALGCGLAGALTPAAAQAPTPGETLARAAAAMAATETERAVELLRDLVASLGPRAPSTLRRDAHLQLGVASWSLGLYDSAGVHVQAAISAEPSTTLDPEESNPDFLTLFRAVKRATLAISVRAPLDTALAPQTERWPVSVAVTRPGSLRFRLAGPGPGGRDTLIASASADSTIVVSFPLVAHDSAGLAPGVYRLAVEYSDTAGRTLATTLSVDVTRQLADTLLHQPPPPDSLYRLEIRWGAPSRTSLARGMGFGLGAGLLPVLLANSRLRNAESRALAVGVSVSLAGVAGYFLGRSRQPLPDNIVYNQALRSRWETGNRAIAAANEQRRGIMLVRLRVVSPP